jgi:hypothetical protein
VTAEVSAHTAGNSLAGILGEIRLNIDRALRCPPELYHHVSLCEPLDLPETQLLAQLRRPIHDVIKKHVKAYLG